MINENWILVKLRKYLTDYNWSIYKLAKESDIPYSSLNNIFIRNTMPTVSTLMKLCNGLGVSMSDFFKDDTLDQPVSHVVKLSDEQADILSKYDRLSASDKKLLAAYLSGLAKEQVFSYPTQPPLDVILELADGRNLLCKLHLDGYQLFRVHSVIFFRGSHIRHTVFLQTSLYYILSQYCSYAIYKTRFVETVLEHYFS